MTDFDIRKIPPTHVSFSNKRTTFEHAEHWIFGDIEATICYNDEKIRVHEEWKKYGLTHRDNDLPSIIHYYDYEKDIRKLEIWSKEKLFYREDDKPSMIEYYENGNIKCKAWKNTITNNHRVGDLPASISYDINGIIEEELYQINGKYHRLYKPAIIDKHIEKWYINGKNITYAVNDFIKECKLPHYSTWSDDQKMLFKLRFHES